MTPEYLALFNCWAIKIVANPVESGPLHLDIRKLILGPLAPMLDYKLVFLCFSLVEVFVHKNEILGIQNMDTQFFKWR